MEVLEGWGLLALQGPEAAGYLQALTSFDLRSLTFGRSAFVPLEGFNLHVARGGYTGEDGFEVCPSIPRLVHIPALMSCPADLCPPHRNDRGRQTPLTNTSPTDWSWCQG
jgi:aminomethyltransferase